MKKILLSLFASVTLSAFAQTNCLDNTFGTGGKVATPIGASFDYGKAVIIQPDGRIIVAGETYISPRRNFGVVRYNGDGSLDNTFGTNGIAITDFGSDVFCSSIALHNDGRIVVAGYSDNGTNYDFALARYNSNGSLDNTFGIGGKVTTDIGNSDDLGNSVAIQSDGKIVVAGLSNNGGLNNDDFALIRYNNDGRLDNTFGTAGKVITIFSSGSSDGVNSVALQTNGQIVAAGWTTTNFALARYNTDGSLDNTFGSSGRVTSTVTASNNRGRSMVIEPSGKIVVAGNAYNNAFTISNFVIARYNSDGSLDNTFGASGKTITAIGVFDVAKSIALHTDGKFIVGGTTQYATSDNFVLARYKNNGSVDSSFCSDGTLILDFTVNFDDEGTSVAYQTDGKIIIAGFAWNSPSTDFALMRFNSNAATGISELIGNAQLFLYPNPATNQLTINLGGMQAEQVSIYNVDGKLIHEVKQPDNNRIDVSNLSSGLYLIRVMANEKSVYRKVIITDRQ